MLPKKQNKEKLPPYSDVSTNVFFFFRPSIEGEDVGKFDQIANRIHPVDGQLPGSFGGLDREPGCVEGLADSEKNTIFGDKLWQPKWTFMNQICLKEGWGKREKKLPCISQTETVYLKNHQKKTYLVQTWQ